MKSSQNISLNLSAVIAFLKRFHFILVFIIVGALLAYCVLTLNSILNNSSNTAGYTSTLTVTTFDQATVNQLENLTTSQDATSIAPLPTGRINPFTE